QAGVPQRVAVVLVSEGATIEVTAARALSSISIATGPSSSFDAARIASIAAVNRDIRDIAKRDPLVSLDPTNSRALSIAGTNSRFNRITVDGIAFQDPFGLNNGGLASARGPVPIDAIGELTVEVAPVDIQQGGFQGGAINTVLKSGENDFRITAFATYSDDSLGGTRIGDRRVDRQFTSENWGAQVTGPIIKDKLFFAVTFERLRDVVPAELGIASEGFANSIPNLTRAQVDQVRQIAQTVYSYDALDLARNVPEQDDKLVVKLDWNVSDQHRASATYIYNKGTTLAGQTTGTVLTQASPPLALQSNNYEQGEILHYGVFQLNSEWSDSFSTTLRASYNDYKRLQEPYNGRDFGQFRVCMDPTSTGVLTNCTAGTPIVQFGPDVSRQANELTVNSLSLEFQARLQRNGHDVKFIVERRGQDINNLFVQNVSGNFYFDSVADLQARRANQLVYAASNDGTLDSTRALFDNITWTFGVQDTWDVTEDFTFIYGMRYDLYEANDRPQFNPNFLARNGFSNTSTLSGRGVLQPRFGFNWRADDRLRLRGSAGLYAGGSPNVWISNSYANTGVQFGTNTINRTAPEAFNGVADFGGLTGNQLGQAVMNGVNGGPGIPSIYDQFVTRTGTAPSLLAVTNALDPNFRIPSQWRLSGSVDYAADLGALGDDWNFGGDVIWSRVKDALVWTDLRSVPIGLLPDGRTRYGQRANTAGTGGANFFDTNPDILMTNTSRGYSWNLVGRFSKNWANGIGINGAYTWQRVKDVNSGTSSVAASNYAQTAVSDPNIADYGTSNYQIDNALRLNFNYEAELWNDNKTRFDLFFNSRSGQRFSYTFEDITATGRSNVFGVTQTGNGGPRTRYLIYVPNVASPTADPLVEYAPGFDFAGFQGVVNGTALNNYQGQIAPKNIGRSPRWNTMDMRISQEVPFPLGGKVELFADMQNVLNFINRDWGALRQVPFPYFGTLVNVSCVAVGTNSCGRYRYSNRGTGATATAGAPETTANPNASLWQIRLGGRISF
ncbi:MAG: TonB-dependent receptor plug domain-containing protein, partial [Sandaracinobacter sp.]